MVSTLTLVLKNGEAPLPVDEKLLFGPGAGSWNLPVGEERRQAVAALRGYAYQLQRSLATWLTLDMNAVLFLEIAEDYAIVGRDPESPAEVLLAVQVKHTRESGSVTLNSTDVIDSLERLWSLGEANPGRTVRLKFLTTSPIGKERRDPLPSGRTGIDAWRVAARGGDVSEIRAALLPRLRPGPLRDFVRDADEAALRSRLLRSMSFACDEPDGSDVEADGRAVLVKMRGEVQATSDLAHRAYDRLLVFMLDVVTKSPTRALTRKDLIDEFAAATSLAVPSAVFMGLLAAKARPLETAQVLDLDATGAWTDMVQRPVFPHAKRAALVDELRATMGEAGALWLHGGSGLGKSTLADTIARATGGVWRVIDMRGVAAAIATERLDAVRGTIASLPHFAGLVVDDLDPAMGAPLLSPLTRLAATLRRREAVCIVTSHADATVRLKHALGIEANAVLAAPSFTSDDVAELVALRGGDPARWTEFVFLASGSGHPQLVDALINGLAAKEWPSAEIEKWIASGFVQDDVEAERDAARRRLLNDLAPDSFDLLCRVTRITGKFDRALAMSLAATAAPIERPAAALDGLVGTWIESVGRGRMRSSPLVHGLGAKMLAEDDLRSLDRAIASDIISRRPVPSDMLDTAFVHAISGIDAAAVGAIATVVIAATGHDRMNAASALPIFRTAASSLVAGKFPEWRALEPLVRLAQYRLVSVLDDEIATATALKAALDAFASQDPDDLSGLETVALSQILLDDSSHGKLNDWPKHLGRLEELVEATPALRSILAVPAKAVGIGVLDFIFVSQATHCANLEGLIGIFDYLDHLQPGARRSRLEAELHGLPWTGMMVDSAWLREAREGSIDGDAAAVVYDGLGRRALGWGQPRLAARCFRAQAIMLDEYVAAPERALAALDDAEALLPDDVLLRRERAKVHWRRKEFDLALRQLASLSTRLELLDPYEAALAFREAALSAGETSRWLDATAFFERAHSAMRSLTGRFQPFSIGLAADAAVARFMSGERGRGVEEMARVLTMLEGLALDGSKNSHYCHAVVRHLVLWMQSQCESGVLVDDRPPAYAVGSGSNVDPPEAILSHPVADIAPAWMLLGRVALRVGVPEGTVLGWTGIQRMRRFAALEVSFRIELLRNAMSRRSVEDLQRHTAPALAAFRHVGVNRWPERLPEILYPEEAEIPALTSAQFSDAIVQDSLRDVVLAASCTFALPRTSDAKLAQNNIRHWADDLVGEDLFDPTRAAAENPMAVRLSAMILSISGTEVLDLADLFWAQLRLLEWLEKSHFRSLVEGLLEERVRLDWIAVCERRRFLLRNPLLNVPDIQAALEAGRTGLAHVATVLLAAAPALPVKLAPELVTHLSKVAGT